MPWAARPCCWVGISNSPISETGELQTTRTSTDLWNEVSYPLQMHDLVDEGLQEDDEVIREMFVLRDTLRASRMRTDTNRVSGRVDPGDDERHTQHGDEPA